MRIRRGVLAAGVLAVAGVAALLVGAYRSARSPAVVREFPDTLIYRGVSRFQEKDFGGAIAAWEEYIRKAPQGADTVSVREMIEEAHQADTGPPTAARGGSAR